jgi:2-polyprenyl-3-methyl-5-hydroxy-6-metoxy-1,4-benzoquinol methylase
MLFEKFRLFLKRRVDESRDAVVKPWLRGNILDVGCGLFLDRVVAGGWMEKGACYTGIDLDEQVITELREKYPKQVFYHLDIQKEKLPHSQSSFDTILLIAVVEHFLQPAAALANIRTLLKDDGVLVITTPSLLGDSIQAILGLGRVGRPALYCPHLKIYNKESLTNLLGTVGFSVITYRKFQFGGNQLFFCQKREAALSKEKA